MAPRAEADGDAPLTRLGGGRWQTRDERFTIEPQSGTWAVVDRDEMDDLGMPLVRGPFRSLTDAKSAIASARSSATPESPLAGRLKEGGRGGSKPERSRPARSRRPDADDEAPAARDEPAARTKASKRTSEDAAEREEPAWLRELAPADRGRARRLIEHLTAAGESDALGIVRRDLAGDVAALAAWAIERRLAELPDDARAAAVAGILVEGRDDDLGVRWRIVDGDGRQILVDLETGRRRGRR